MQQISKIFNEILKSEVPPKQWLESNIILIFKSGDKNSITNYRPISLISHLCKLFMKILMMRTTTILDNNQPPEQAGFRSKFFDHRPYIHREPIS